MSIFRRRGRRCLALVLGAALVACTQGAEPEETGQGDRVRIEFWYQPNGLDPKALMETELARFEEDHPHIEVDARMIGWEEALTKLATATRSGAAPDVATVGSGWLADLNVDDALHALDDDLDQLPSRDVFHPAMWDTGVDGAGRTIGMPWLVVTRLLFYRPSLLAEAGVDPGTDLRDWAGFEASLERLRDAGGDAEPWGVSGRHDWNVVHNVLAWIWAAGGQPVDDEGSASLASSETFRGLRELQRLVASYSDRQALAGDDVDLGYGFAEGRYAMTISGPWLARTLEAELRSDDWDAVPLPAGPAGTATMVGGSHLAVFADTAELDASLELVAFLTDTESQSRMAEATGLLPARLDVPMEGREAAASRAALRTAQPYPTVPGWLEIEHALQRSFSRMWASVEQGVPLTDAELAVLLEDAGAQVEDALDGR